MSEEQKRPWQLTVPQAKDAIVGELAEPGPWIVAHVEASSFWPVNAQKVPYRGETIWIIPLMINHYPAVAMKKVVGQDRLYCERLLMRFLSALAWVEETGFIVHGLGGGSLPMPMGREKERGFAICDEFDLSYLPEPSDQRALLALALMREGRALNHPAYAFLSFYRVLEAAFPATGARNQWVSACAPSLQAFGVREVLADLAQSGVTDIGRHLYESGRCAIAHARAAPIVDPDDPSDYRRLQSEMPIMVALATKAIEDQLGVETPSTVYQKHLYELAGFKEMLGAEVVGYLTRGEQITDGRVVDIPNIGVLIRRREPYKLLSNLTIKEMGQTGHVLQLIFESQAGDVRFWFQLDFAAERLNFSWQNGLSVTDKGSVVSAENLAEASRFTTDYFGNGQLHIINAATGALIARKDAFIPLNMYLDGDAAKAEYDRWMHEAENRRERDARFGRELERLSTPYKVCVRFGQ